MCYNFAYIIIKFVLFIVVNAVELELLLKIERTRLEREQLSARHSGTASSGLRTPTSAVKSDPSTRAPSVAYYFNEIRKHFKANNSVDQYAIACTRFTCIIFDGKTDVHNVDVDRSDSTSIRNLYLMFHASDYKVETFLRKRDAGEFESFDWSASTPPQYYARSIDVDVVDK